MIESKFTEHAKTRRYKKTDLQEKYAQQNFSQLREFNLKQNLYFITTPPHAAQRLIQQARDEYFRQKTCGYE
jgi:pyrroline-5-carboxylate reductase